MIVISKEEANEVRRKIPNVHIVRTMKNKSKRHRYYCEETRQVMRVLNKMRNPYDQPLYNKSNIKKG